jgi:hypothetical protein
MFCLVTYIHAGWSTVGNVWHDRWQSPRSASILTVESVPGRGLDGTRFSAAVPGVEAPFQSVFLRTTELSKDPKFSFSLVYFLLGSMAF